MSITSIVNDLVTSVSVVNALKPLPPTISGYSVAGKDDLALDPAGGQTVQINGTGFLPGATITFDGSAVSVVTYVNPNQLTFTSPAKSAGTYTIYAVNPDGGTAIYIPGIIYSVLPTWTTSAGTLGSYYETTSISNTVVASGDAPITYSLFSGSLPTGSTLYANGVITGTAPIDSSSTTYSFTIQATDAQLQDSTRSFSLTINVDAVTWVSPANNTTYTSTANSAIANVTLSATDAAGYSVSYSANALPTGLSLSGANITGTPTVVADSSTLLTATAATTNRTATRTINWSITVSNDTYFEYNTLLIPGASTTFVDDASTNNFAVTINGDTKPNSFNPYTPGYYSNYFDGSGDYLTVPNNAALNVGSSTFTLECWFYNQQNLLSGSEAGVGTIAAKSDYNGSNTNGYSLFCYDGNNSTPSTRLTLFLNGVSFSLQTSVNAVPFNTWTHVAVVKSGTTLTIYCNGVSVATTSSAPATINDTSTVFIIGSQINGTTFNGTYPLSGYVSNLRLVKGTAVYTAAFTPPTSPLTAITNTSLLTCQSNRFIDNSTNNFTITRYGDTKIQSFQPFTPNTSYSTYGSGYFDGSGDYLNLNGQSAFAFGSSASFTIQFWFYATAISADVVFYDGRPTTTQGLYPTLWLNGTTKVVSYVTNSTEVITGTTTIVVNQWYYVTLSRNSGSTRLFVNGVQQGSTYADTINYANPASRPTIMQSGYASNGYLTGYVTDFQVLNGTGYSSVTVPTTPLTAIANTSLLTLQNNQSVNNNVFLDNSSNNFLITRNGNTAPGTFSPYGGNWSNYFTNNILSCGNSALIAGTNTFTIEFWIYLNSINSGGGNNQTFIDTRSSNGVDSTAWLIGVINSTNLKWFTGTSDTNLGGTLPYRQWVHVAYTRNGSNVITAYINGVATGTTTTDSRNLTNTNFWIGGNVSNTYPLDGYFSNVRWVVGTVVYTGNFTPSTTPLTAITNTKLLTCQSNRFVDNSVNNVSISLTGSPTVQRFSPFNPSSLTPTSYSGYFDGNGDVIYATESGGAFTFGTGDYEYSAWIFTTDSGSGQQTIFGRDNTGNTAVPYIYIQPTSRLIGLYYSSVILSGTTAIAANSWYYITVSRVSGTSRLFVNGVLEASAADSTNLTAAGKLVIGGQWTGNSNMFVGYISNARVVKGSGVTSVTVPTTPLTAISGTSLLTLQSTTFIDNSTNNFAITAVGDSRPSQQNPFGYTSATTNGYTASTIGGSGYFDGTGDYLTVDHSTAFNLSGIAFTIEAWVYTITSSGYRNILTKRPASAGPSYQIWINNTDNKIGIGNATTPQYSNSQIATNTWNHVAWTYDGSATSKMWINGVLDTTVTLSPSADNANPITIGAWGLNGSEYFNGYITDVRIVKGSQVYTTAFIPPATPLTAVKNTVLLNNMTSAGVYDASMLNNMETIGDAKLSTAVSKFGGSSMSFDGSGDLLKGVLTPNAGFGTGDFTVECWLYVSAFSNATGYMGIYSNRTANGLSTAFDFGIQNSTSKLYFYNANTDGTTFSTGTLSATTWIHVALVRSGSTITFYINGTASGSLSSSSNLGTSNAPYVGGNVNTSPDYYNGYIDDLRITRGYARYTSNFTAPTTAFPVY